MKKNLVQRLFPGQGYGLFLEEIGARVPESGQILDLGCGDNRMLAGLCRPGLAVWGVDYEAHPGLARPDRFRLLGRDGAIPFADGIFDLVVSRWVWEHVREPRDFLQEAARVLRPGGRFVSLTVHAWHYVAWLARISHWMPHSWTQRLIRRLYRRAEHDTFPTCYLLNTVQQLQNALEGLPLRLEHSIHYPCPDYFQFSPLLWSLAVLSDWSLEKVWPSLGKLYWIVTLQRRPVASSDVNPAPHTECGAVSDPHAERGDYTRAA